MVSFHGIPAAPRVKSPCRFGAYVWSRRTAACSTVRPERSTPAALMPGLIVRTWPVAGTVMARGSADSATTSARRRRDMAEQGSAAYARAAQRPCQPRWTVGLAPWEASAMAFPALLSEVSLGPAVLRNRVVSTAHQTGLVHDHLPTDDLVAYHEARARGGVGAVFIEATATHETGLLTAHTIGGYLTGIVGAYERLGAAVRGHGARLFVQLL